MKIVEIGDAGDPRVQEYTKLTDVELRIAIEPSQGLFLAESEKVILRALNAGFTPRSVLTEPRWLDSLTPALRDLDVDVYLADAAVLKDVTGYRLHRGALAAFNRKPLPSVSDILTCAKLVVVLEDLVDHTNVGLIFRSAAALGADAILVSPRCADPMYRRSVKVSMGAVFAIPWTVAEPWPWLLDDLADLGFTRLALTPAADALDLRQWDPAGADRVALLLGTEGPGLSDEAFARVDQKIRIPMSHGVDSLNVAATAAVACFVLATPAI